MSDVDWNKEGLLGDLEGEDRQERVELLDQLHEAGVELDELRTAVEEERLTLLPVERVIGGDYTLTPNELAERAGLDLDVTRAQWQALGLPRLADDEKRLGERDVEAAQQLKQFIDAGLPADGILSVSRVMGEGMAKTVDAVLDLVGQAFLQAGESERDLGLRYAQAAEQLIPLMEEQLKYVFNLHMREGIRTGVISATERSTGKLSGAKEVAVCFADLVGFTKMGENLPPEEIGSLAGELADMAADVAEPPVRLVKTIGDAAMFVADDNDAMIKVALELVARADDAREGFPQLRAGVASGPALGRGGDWYGRPVNVASRVTSVARPGSVVATAGAREGLDDDYRWTYIGKRKLKGVKGEVPLFRARRLDGDGDGD